MLDVAPNLLEKVENAFTTNLGRKRIKDLEKKKAKDKKEAQKDTEALQNDMKKTGKDSIKAFD